MNISTYEARIKALEDQLNPPVPGGSTGLLSVTVSPDITLGDGTSLNAKLAALMPLEPDADQRILDTDAGLSRDTEYTVTAKPGNEWYGVVVGQTGRTIGDTAGAPVSLNLTPTITGNRIILNANVGASATGTEEGQASMVKLNIERNIQD